MKFLGWLPQRKSVYERMVERLQGVGYILKRTVEPERPNKEKEYVVTSASDPSLFNLIGVRTIDDVVRRSPVEVTLAERYTGRAATFYLRL